MAGLPAELVGLNIDMRYQTARVSLRVFFLFFSVWLCFGVWLGIEQRES